MSGSDRELEEGQIPTVTVPNDGSFLTKFLKGDIARADTDAATRSLDDAYQPAPGNEGPEPPKAEGAAPAPALAAAPPKPAKPPAVLKSKRSVLAKRLPPGAQLPAKKKAKEKGRRGARLVLLEKCLIFSEYCVFSNVMIASCVSRVSCVSAHPHCVVLSACSFQRRW